MNKEELIELWKHFAEKNDFKLNPEGEHISHLAESVLQNEKTRGYRFCPCRIGDDNDLGLLCPCNFKAQPNWSELDRCWCGLFVKR